MLEVKLVCEQHVNTRDNYQIEKQNKKVTQNGKFIHQPVSQIWEEPVSVWFNQVFIKKQWKGMKSYSKAMGTQRTAPAL